MNEMNWDDLRLFLAVCRAGGLGGAAVKTGKSAATLGRRMLNFERAMGLDLFNRHARGYDLTSAGEELRDQALAFEGRIAGLLRPAEDRDQPLIKISAGTWVTELLCQNSHKIFDKAQVRLRFIADDSILNMRHREAVIGVRNHPQTDPSLAAQKIGKVSFAWFSAVPKPQRYACVLANTPSAKWVRQQVKSEDRVEVTHPRNALDLALAGEAQAVLPLFVGNRHPELKRVSDPIAELTHDQWLVVHQDDRHIPAVRQVINLMLQVLKLA